MVILFWVVTILFTIVQSRIIHYSSLAWFSVTFLAANTLYKWQRKELDYKKYVGVLIAILGGIVALLLLAAPFIAMNLKKLIPYVDDKFAQANMAADVNWSGLEGLIGVLLVVAIVVGIWRLRQGEYSKAAWTLFTGTALVIFSASAVIVPKVERYSQGAAVDFHLSQDRRGIVMPMCWGMGVMRNCSIRIRRDRPIRIPMTSSGC